MVASIIMSFIVGQKEQMAEQIDEFGVQNFIAELESLDETDEIKFKILKSYLMIRDK